MNERDDEHRRQQRCQKQASVIEEGGIPAHKEHERHQTRKGSDARTVGQSTLAARQPPRSTAQNAPLRKEEGKKRSYEKREGPGVGPVVHAGRITRRIIEYTHQKGRDGDQCHQSPLDGATTHFVPEQQQQDGREHQIKLLFNGQRPEMIQRRGGSHGLEIAEILEDEPPIAEEEKRGEHIIAKAHQQSRRKERCENCDNEHEEHDGRHKPSNAVHPEMRQIDLACAIPFLDEDACNEIARQNEKDGNAEKSAGKHGSVHMVEHDGNDRDRAQPIQSGNVTLACRKRPPLRLEGIEPKAPLKQKRHPARCQSL